MERVTRGGSGKNNSEPRRKNATEGTSYAAEGVAGTLAIKIVLVLVGGAVERSHGIMVLVNEGCEWKKRDKQRIN